MQSLKVYHGPSHSFLIALVIVGMVLFGIVIRINGGSSWTGRGLVGSCPYFLKLGPASGTTLGVFSSPQAELCSLLTSTSWEPMQVLLLWWLLSELLEEWSCFFGVGPAMNSGNGHPTGGVPTKGISVKRGISRMQSSSWISWTAWGNQSWWSLWPGCSGGSWDVLTMLVWWWPMLHPYSERELQKRHTKVAAWSNQLGLP